jgi:benzoate/toluate 1,2-dioxygenase subunit alpha
VSARVSTNASGGAVNLDELLLPDRVHRRLYTDPAIYDEEMRTLFRRAWIYVGHESEVRNVGDYKRAKIGSEPVILVRGEDEAVRVLVNRCRHRGALVCREEKGNGKFFRCPYHAWTYRNNGELMGVPKRSRYPRDFDLGELGLVNVPRVESYRGLVFACFDDRIEPLVDYLGPVRNYVDATLDFSLSGEIDLSVGVSRHRYPGNWKIQMENGVDGYHTAFVHETYIGIMSRAEEVELKFGSHGEDQGWTETFPRGHAVLARRADPRAIDVLRGQFPEYTSALEAKHGSERLLEILAHMNVFVFPNLFLIGHQIRVVQPVSVAETEVMMYPYLLADAPEALNLKRMAEHEGFYPPTGFGTPDDYEVFSAVTEGLQAMATPWLLLNRGAHDCQDLGDGVRRGTPTDEIHQRAMYDEYARLLGSDQGGDA